MRPGSHDLCSVTRHHTGIPANRDWGLGTRTGDWGLGTGNDLRLGENSNRQVSNPQSPIPNPQSPIPSPQSPVPSPHPQSPLPSPQSPIPSPQSPVPTPPVPSPHPQPPVPSPQSPPRLAPAPAGRLANRVHLASGSIRGTTLRLGRRVCGPLPDGCPSGRCGDGRGLAGRRSRAGNGDCGEGHPCTVGRNTRAHPERSPNGTADHGSRRPPDVRRRRGGRRRVLHDGAD